MSLEQLQGSWVITDLRIEGRKMPAAGRIAIKGSRFTTQSMGAEYKGKVAISGNQIDLHFTSGPEKDNVTAGIFRFRGDALEICLALTAKERPTKFAAPAGSGFALEKLRRDDSPAVPDATLPATLEAAPELSGEWQMVKLINRGEPLAAEYVKQSRRSATPNEFRVKVMGQTVLHAHFTVDRSTKPYSIDYYVHAGKKLTLQQGIWKLEGDVLSTCIAAPGATRPKKFVSDSANTLSVWNKIG